jgi:hypothetical protein
MRQGQRRRKKQHREVEKTERPHRAGKAPQANEQRRAANEPPSVEQGRVTRHAVKLHQRLRNVKRGAGIQKNAAQKKIRHA